MGLRRHSRTGLRDKAPRKKVTISCVLTFRDVHPHHFYTPLKGSYRISCTWDQEGESEYQGEQKLPCVYLIIIIIKSSMGRTALKLWL